MVRCLGNKTQPLRNLKKPLSKEDTLKKIFSSPSNTLLLGHIIYDWHHDNLMLNRNQTGLIPFSFDCNMEEGCY